MFFAFVAGITMATIVQTMIPTVAQVPGALICKGDSLHLVFRRRSAYGFCAAVPEQRLSYAPILGVSLLVWTALLSPLGVALGWWMGSRPVRKPR
jgi:hypothetical protein